ncbi:cytochrome bd oxidase small subunit CydS [Alkalicoccus daliensis]|uniref:Uncharacterized protein n=1 Tax=Alkalicoccus daliensis TaxID=745820 RepID=A0A1H0ICQ1_9BACI|nr:hypothetical protein [Alkalicoccus daliensis]SDO29145.1 hypothetical protein SAMN04488053_11091 [Alkalicoccus daliensis]
MDFHDFLIFVAPQLVLICSVVFVFIWGAKAAPPAFLQEAEKTDYENPEEETYN